MDSDTINRQVRLPRALLDAAEAEAARRGISFAALIRTAVAKEIGTR